MTMEKNIVLFVFNDRILHSLQNLLRPLTVVALISLYSLSALSLPASAAVRGTPDGFADLVEQLSPAVVNISTTKNTGGVGKGEEMEPYRGKLGQQSMSMGSGFIISADGVVVTNNHVIDKADNILVKMNDGHEYEAVVVGVDRETDIAVLRIKNPKDKLPYVSWGDSVNARVGDWVVAIGNPFGLGGSVSAGIISARNRDIESGTYDDYIQTDAAINRGNSGGPLFNMDGRVIGMNTAIFSQTGGSVGVGFAIPADLAGQVVKQLVEFGETRRGWLGVTLDELDRDKAALLNLDNTNGALVESVRDASPALAAGFKPDDVVILFDNKRITNTRDLTRAVADTPVGKTVKARVIRNGKKIYLTVTVTRREDVRRVLSSYTPDIPEGASLASGLILQEPTEEIRQLFGLAADVKGVVVTAVDADSPAANVLLPGDVILEIAWEKINNPFDAANKFKMLRKVNPGPIQVYVQRGDLLFYELIQPWD
jgi:serine protease Do